MFVGLTMSRPMPVPTQTSPMYATREEIKASLITDDFVLSDSEVVFEDNQKIDREKVSFTVRS